MAELGHKSELVMHENIRAWWVLGCVGLVWIIRRFDCWSCWLLLTCNVFKVLECNHHTCDVVKAPFECSELQNSVSRLPTLFMQSPAVCLTNICQRWFLEWRLPDTLDYFLITQFLEHSITGQDNEVVVVSDFEAFYVWRWYHYSRITSILNGFSLDVSNSAWYRKSTREHTMRTNY